MLEVRLLYPKTSQPCPGIRTTVQKRTAELSSRITKLVHPKRRKKKNVPFELLQAPASLQSSFAECHFPKNASG